jgi:hypothetical protein
MASAALGLASMDAFHESIVDRVVNALDLRSR